VRVNRTIMLTGVVSAALAAGVVPIGVGGGHSPFAGPPLALAQNIGQRTVSGSVLDPNSLPLAGATVFLKDLKAKSIRSYTSDSNGRFRFTQVNMSIDHELWAEKDGKKSATKTVSTWDSRKDFDCELKLK